MARKRALLYEILGGGDRSLGSRPEKARDKRRKPRSRMAPARYRTAPWWKGRRGSVLAVAVVFLVVSGVAYYIGSLGNHSNSRPKRLLRRTDRIEGPGRVSEPQVTPPALREYWTVQVISYDDSPRGRERAMWLIGYLDELGFEDVHGLVSDNSSKIGVAVGRYRRKEALEEPLDELRALKIEDKRQFASAQPRRVTTE
jgi:hypothetical protein